MIKKRCILLFVIIGLYCINCSVFQTEKIRYQKDSNETKKEVLKYVVVGNSIASAKEIMEQDHFKCEMIFNGSFRGNDKVHENVDFLWCYKSVFASLFIERRYQISFVNNKGLVSDIFVSVGLIGF